MTLSFRTAWPESMGEWAGKSTNFTEAIWNGLNQYHVVTGEVFDEWALERSEVSTDLLDHSKIHTIREDKHDRWGYGSNIHFVINNRRPDRFQFAPVVKCVSVQNIQIWQNIDEFGFILAAPSVHIENRNLNEKEIVKLALNDGFESVEQFFTWFNTDFTGKIIHWTDLEY